MKKGLLLLQDVFDESIIFSVHRRRQKYIKILIRFVTLCN